MLPNRVLYECACYQTPNAKKKYSKEQLRDLQWGWSTILYKCALTLPNAKNVHDGVRVQTCTNVHQCYQTLLNVQNYGNLLNAKKRPRDLHGVRGQA